jgi:hypothetical protein
MGDKNIVVDSYGNVSDPKPRVKRQKKVFWFPDDSDGTITIEFTTQNPCGWSSNKKTGQKGHKVTCSVTAADGVYEYSATSSMASGDAGGILANPELIVDGGLVRPRGKKKGKPAKSTATTAKKRKRTSKKR